MNKKFLVYLALHINLLLFSFASIFSKLASGSQFLSIEFIGYFISLFLILVIYAFFWQKILKNLPLTSAYSSRSVLIIWGFIWGILFFNEKITYMMLFGSVLIIIGLTLVVNENE